MPVRIGPPQPPVPVDDPMDVDSDTASVISSDESGYDTEPDEVSGLTRLLLATAPSPSSSVAGSMPARSSSPKK